MPERPHADTRSTRDHVGQAAHHSARSAGHCSRRPPTICPPRRRRRAPAQAGPPPIESQYPVGWTAGTSPATMAAHSRRRTGPLVVQEVITARKLIKVEADRCLLYAIWGRTACRRDKDVVPTCQPRCGPGRLSSSYHEICHGALGGILMALSANPAIIGERPRQRSAPAGESVRGNLDRYPQYHRQ